MNLDIVVTAFIIIGAIALVWAILAFIIGKLHEGESLKYEFVTIIAHKFRTPLTHIKWSTENLLGEEQDSFKKQSLTDLKNSNDNLIELTNTLIEMTDAVKSAKVSYNLEKIDVCALAQQSVDAAKQSFKEKNLFMSMNCSANYLAVKGDRTRLEFVLSTLLENACTYTSPGRNVSVNVTANWHKVFISVTDDGVGIDPHDMPNIFTKFYRTKQAQSIDTEGFGVGLYLAGSIMKRHKGKLMVNSEGLGKGSTFSVVLPRVK